MVQQRARSIGFKGMLFGRPEVLKNLQTTRDPLKPLVFASHVLLVFLGMFPLAFDQLVRLWLEKSRGVTGRETSVKPGGTNRLCL